MLKKSALSIVVLCIVLFSTPIETYMSYALNRIFDTAIGVIAALLVNYFLPRPRVVSLWEGFKGSFKKDSKVLMLFRAPLRRGAFLLPSAVIQWAYYHFP